MGKGKGTGARKAPLLARATLTSKGQITLPSAVRRELGLKPGDQVAFADGRLIPLPRSVDLAGSMPPRSGRSLSIEELREQVADEHAERHATRRAEPARSR